MEKYPRVLVISHNPFSDTQNNGKTLSAFFSGWPKDKIAQLYLTPDKPDFTICEKFYRITDLDVLKRFIKKGSCGSEIKRENILSNEKEILHKNKLYIFIRNLFLKRLPIMYCIRNIVWQKVKPWNDKKLEDWINEFKPEVVFFQSSNVYSVFDMVNHICNKFKTILFMETTDDYVTKHFSIDPFYLIDINKMIEKYQVLVNKSKCIFAIGSTMADEYKKRFGGNYKIAMNSIEITDKVIPYSEVNNSTILLTYAGNLGLNRWKVLKKIGEELNELRKEKGINAKLEIYSLNTPNKKIKKALTNETMNFIGSLNSEKLINKRNKSDILVHVESFDKKNRYITRLSISTKIPEYLLSERCILAIGPKSVASIKYIYENNMGKIVTSLNKKNLKKELENIILDRKKREEYIKNGIKIAKKNHSFEKNKKMIQNTILDSCITNKS